MFWSLQVSGIKSGSPVWKESGASVGDWLLAVDSLWCDNVTVMRFLSRLANPKHDSLLVLCRQHADLDSTGSICFMNKTTSFCVSSKLFYQQKFVPCVLQMSAVMYTSAIVSFQSSLVYWYIGLVVIVYLLPSCLSIPPAYFCRSSLVFPPNKAQFPFSHHLLCPIQFTLHFPSHFHEWFYYTCSPQYISVILFFSIDEL